MNDASHSKSKPNASASDKYSYDDGRIPAPMSLQPTPINPEGIVPVNRVSIQATQWNLDNKSIEYLQGLSASKTSKFAAIANPVIPALPAIPNEASRPFGAIAIPSQASKPPVAPSSSSKTEVTSYPDAALLRQKQVDQWNARYAELLGFRKEHGHCLVPLRYQPNKALSNWVKRQRYQYRIKSEGKHSTLNDERQATLEKLGFVWDSHSSAWEERFQELSEFQKVHGHANVPKSYKQSQQLAIWVKSQRRHFRLHCNGKASAMTEERIERLKSLGFVFNPRSQTSEREEGNIEL
ncbi:MAG: hypothetical protein SGBAC_013265 [Bacillariaceae sp.]